MDYFFLVLKSMFIEITIFKMIFKAFTLRTIRFSARTSKLSHLTPVAPSLGGIAIIFVLLLLLPFPRQFISPKPVSSFGRFALHLPKVVLLFILSLLDVSWTLVESLSLLFQPVFVKLGHDEMTISTVPSSFIIGRNLHLRFKN